MSDEATGGCECGAVRYRVAGDVAAAYACHCRECQLQSASAFGISVPVWANNLELKGALHSWSRSTDSGGTTECFFCPTCGCRIYHANPDLPGMITVKGGTLDDAIDLRLVAHIWVDSRQGWLDLPGNVPQWPQQPRDMAGWAKLLTGTPTDD